MAVPISNVTRRVVYAPSGTGPYAFTFEILAQTDIEVYKGDTLLTLTTDYSVTINANGTGSVTLVATAGTDNITIIGARAIQRLSDFVTGGDFFANTVNDELDSLTIFAQQNSEAVSRALQAPETDPTTINMTLPRAATRANKTLAFDSNGNPVIGEIIGDNRGNWAAGTAYNKRDIVKDTSNYNIYLCNTAHTSSGSQPISTNTDAAKWDLLVDAAAAGAAQTAAEAAQAAAEAAQAAAETAETNAETAETNAETAETNDAASASAASTSASNAASSASTASTAATNAGNSATAAAASESAAATSASNASTSASNASTSASAASSSASAAASSASAASTSESNAASSASAASTSASNAATSATNASNSATSAASAQSAAEAARDSALAAYDNFDDRYLGAKASDPTLDNDGDALLAGALYYNTTDEVMKLYTGSAWVAAYVSGDGFLAAANNLSDLDNAATARTNLGVASDSTQTLTNKTISGASNTLTVDGTNEVGFRNVPAVGTKTTSYQLQTADVGKYVQIGSGGSITIPDATFSEGDAVSLFNNTTGDITVTCSITTAYIAGADSDVASVTLATRGICTIFFISGTVCVITGNVS